MFFSGSEQKFFSRAVRTAYYVSEDRTTKTIEERTKVPITSRHQNLQTKLMLNNKSLEPVRVFKHLDSTIGNDGRNQREVFFGIFEAQQAFEVF